MTTNTLAFEILPHQLIVKIAYNSVFWLNFLPHKNVIHTTQSPQTSVMGSKIQVKNSLLPKTAGSMALCPMRNKQGSYYSLSLNTGKRLVRNSWNVLPMPAKIISTVHQFTAACKKHKGITFTNKDGNIVNDNNDPESDIADNIEITGVDRTENENNNRSGHNRK